MKNTRQTPETLFDVLWDKPPKLKADYSYSLDFKSIKEFRIGDFIYKNPNRTITEDTVFASLRWNVNPRDFIINFNWICPICQQPFLLENPFITDIQYCPHCNTGLVVNWDSKASLLDDMQADFYKHQCIQNTNIGVPYAR